MMAVQYFESQNPKKMAVQYFESQNRPRYRCLGPSTVIVLLYAVGCVVVGFLVGFIVMQMDKSKAKKRKQSIDGDNIENKVTSK